MIAIGGFKEIVIEQGGVWAVCHTIFDTEYAFSVTPEEAFDIIDWYQGNRSIQDALGYLSPDYRELLMTGMPPGSWGLEPISTPFLELISELDFVDPIEQFELDL